MAGAHLHRAASATLVVLLHLGLLGAFLFFANTTRPLVGNPFHEIEITFGVPTRPAPPPISPALRPRFLTPASPALPAAPGPLLAPSVQPAPPAPGAISGVGRALFGCDPLTLDRLPAKDRAACLRLPKASASPVNVRMPSPPDPNSPFTKEIEERFREAVPINRPCPLGSFNDTHGLPCFGFQGEESAPLHAPQ